MKASSAHGIIKHVASNRLFFVLAALAVFLMVGCSHTERVRVPPRVDLAGYQTIGIVEFSGNSKDNLEPMVTQNFMQSVQSAQPNVRFIELGAEGQLLREIKRKRLDSKSVKAIGKSYQVDALFTGYMKFSEVKPSIKLSTNLKSMKAKAYIEGALNTRLWQANNGATRWTKSTTGQQSVANVNLNNAGPISFGVNDPKEKYGPLIQDVVKTNTKDFYSYYVTRKVNK